MHEKFEKQWAQKISVTGARLRTSGARLKRECRHTDSARTSCLSYASPHARLCTAHLSVALIPLLRTLVTLLISLDSANVGGRSAFAHSVRRRG
jgi:hypothetical protein